jgi:outer membrane lipoprotein-sorting protein
VSAPNHATITVRRPLRAFARVLIVAAAIVTGVGSLVAAQRPPAGAAATESFDELYARGQKINNGIKTLTAHFTETTSSALLTRPLVARGTLAVERPTRVVLHYEEPDARVVLVDGNKMTTTWPQRQVIDIGAAQGRVQKYFVNGTAAELRQQFDINDREPNDRPGTYHVSMVPKRKQIREALTRLDLWVKTESSLLEAMKMTFANGDTKLMTFEDVVANATLPPNVFVIK